MLETRDTIRHSNDDTDAAWNIPHAAPTTLAAAHATHNMFDHATHDRAAHSSTYRSDPMNTLSDAKPRGWASVKAGVFGFVLGVFVWHLVGFWAFISDTVLPDADRARVTSSMSQLRSGINAEITTGALQTRMGRAEKIAGTVGDTATASTTARVAPDAAPDATAYNCLELQRDVVTGQTIAVPCRNFADPPAGLDLTRADMASLAKPISAVVSTTAKKSPTQGWSIDVARSPSASTVAQEPNVITP